MQLCEGEEEDTQCCFFNETFPSSKQRTAITKLSLAGACKHRNAERNPHVPQKQSRLISKNNKKQNSHQKAKLSLSKLSGRKASNSRDHYAQVQTRTHTVTSASAPKSGIVHNQQSYIQSIHKQNNYLPTSRCQPNSNQQQEWNQPSLHCNSIKPTSVRLYDYENHIMKPKIDVTNYPPHNQLPRQVMGPWQNKVTFHQPQPQYRLDPMQINEPSGFEKMTAIVRNYHIPQNKQQNLPLNNKNEVHWSFQDKSRQKINLNPANDTAHNLVYQVQKIPNQDQHQLNRHKNPGFSPAQRHFSESRYTDQQSPCLKPNLKTVQSFYSEDVNLKKQVQQSIIVVDYFNPSQNIRREMEERLEKRHHAFHPF